MLDQKGMVFHSLAIIYNPPSGNTTLPAYPGKLKCFYMCSYEVRSLFAYSSATKNFEMSRSTKFHIHPSFFSMNIPYYHYYSEIHA